MASDELRAAVETDVELDQLLTDLGERLQAADPEALTFAVARGDEAEITSLLELHPQEADERLRRLVAIAREYAERFPELATAARFMGPNAP